MALTRGVDLPQPEQLNIPNRLSSNFAPEELSIFGGMPGETTEPWIFFNWDNDDLFYYNCNADSWTGNDDDIGDTGWSVGANTAFTWDLSNTKWYGGNTFDEFKSLTFDPNSLDSVNLSTAWTNLTAPGSFESGKSHAKLVHPCTSRNASAPDDNSVFWCDGDSEVRKYSISGDSWSTITDVPQGNSKMFWLPDIDPVKLYFVTNSSNANRCYEMDIATPAYTQIGGDFYNTELAGYNSHWAASDQYIYMTGKAELSNDKYYGGGYIPVYRLEPDPTNDLFKWRLETTLPVQIDIGDTIAAATNPLLYYTSSGARLEYVKIGTTEYLYWMDVPNVAVTSETLGLKFWRVQLI